MIACLGFLMAAGIIVYFSTLTTNHVELEPKKFIQAEGSSVLVAHTKDPVILEALKESKIRWYQRRDTCVFEEYSIVSGDGINLAGFFWSRKKDFESNNKTVVLVHGMTDSGAGMGYLAEEYHERGWDVLCIDQRSHGESEGKKRTMGIREAEDIALWIALLIEKKRANKIFLHGVSMGGAAVLLYAELTKELPTVVKGIISDSSYASYFETFNRLLFLVLKNQILSRSITLGASIASLFFSGVRFGKMNPQKKIQKISIPILIFHGQKDVMVPIGMVRKMFSLAIAKGVEVVVVPEAPHIGAYFYAPKLYMQKIEDFCSKMTISQETGILSMKKRTS